MPKYYDKLPFNPFIHGTSSQTLSMMQSTDFQLMPVIAMLQDFKIAPMIGELNQGGFSAIGDGLNHNTITGAPAFGRMQHSHYNLDRVIQDYTKYSDTMNRDVCKDNFKKILKHSHQSAFTNLNLLMIYLVRLRQLGVKAADVAPLVEINALKERLNASVQFYYFILCIQKYIFIDVAEMERFKKENNLDDFFAFRDYIQHYFSFENFIEKIRRTGFKIEEIYNSPSSENLNKLIEFVKISKGSQEYVKRDSAEDDFIAQRDYHFFTQDQHELGCKINYDTMNSYLFTNSGFSFDYYLQIYHQSYSGIQDNDEDNALNVPDFKQFHEEVLPYIEALKDRIRLCYTLLDADDHDFVPYDKSNALCTKPFPVVFVTEAKTLEEFHDEYRSRTPLKLGKEILLVATDNKNNQQRLRDYLQNNNVGPVEVLLFNDLQILRSQPHANYFDAFASDDLSKAFELAKKQNYETQFSKLYRALSELNEKRYRFKLTHPEIYEKLNHLFNCLQKNILTSDKDKINFRGIQEALQHSMQENYELYASHRGALGVIDTALTILASLVVFYPITYMVQKSRNSIHTFFATDTEKKVNYALKAADEVVSQAAVI